MRNYSLVMIILVLLLTACQATTPAPAETEVAEPAPVVQASTPTAFPRGTSTTAQTAETPPVENVTVSDDSPGCVVQSPFPTPGPTEQSLYPPPGERDWIKGPDSATVTFTEYSDFQ
jgi:hypothetical protein